jgi:hypothetical protein
VLGEEPRRVFALETVTLDLRPLTAEGRHLDDRWAKRPIRALEAM